MVGRFITNLIKKHLVLTKGVCEKFLCLINTFATAVWLQVSPKTDGEGGPEKTEHGLK